MNLLFFEPNKASFKLLGNGEVAETEDDKRSFVPKENEQQH